MNWRPRKISLSTGWVLGTTFYEPIEETILLSRETPEIKILIRMRATSIVRQILI